MQIFYISLLSFLDDHHYFFLKITILNLLCFESGNVEMFQHLTEHLDLDPAMFSGVQSYFIVLKTWL